MAVICAESWELHCSRNAGHLAVHVHNGPAWQILLNYPVLEEESSGEWVYSGLEATVEFILQHARVHGPYDGLMAMSQVFFALSVTWG